MCRKGGVRVGALVWWGFGFAAYAAAWVAVALRASAAEARMHSTARSPLPEGVITLRLEL